MRADGFTRGMFLTFSLACFLGAASPATAQSAATPVAAIPVASLPVKPATPAVVTLTHADEFSTLAAATSHCPGDSVVWSSLSKSKVFHVSTSKYYGKTKHGAYVCQKAAIAAGFHAAKT